MSFSKRPRSEAEFVAAADAIPPENLGALGRVPKLEATGFAVDGVKALLDDAGGGAEPWVEHDPRARPRNVFNLRLNDHDLEILRHLAAQNEDLSMQKIASRILVPELRRRVGIEG